MESWAGPENDLRLLLSSLCKIQIHTDTACVQHVNVGCSQAHPNNDCNKIPNTTHVMREYKAGEGVSCCSRLTN